MANTVGAILFLVCGLMCAPPTIGLAAAARECIRARKIGGTLVMGFYVVFFAGLGLASVVQAALRLTKGS